MISSSYSGISINDPDELIDSIKKVHTKVPLTGKKTNELLALKDKQLQYLIAAIRNTPQIPENWSEDEWKEWLATLIPHRILSLLALHISTWEEKFRPPDFIYSRLIKEFHQAAIKSVLIDHQLLNLSSIFEKEKIEVIIVKGVALARSIYPDTATRISCDIDLFVQPENIKNLENILENLGYRCPEHTFDISPDIFQEEVFFTPKNMANIDIHWSIDRNFSLFDQDWLDKAFISKQLIQYNNFNFFTFNPINHLEYLAFHHIFQHDSMTFDWIMDIAYLFPKLTIEDWKIITKKSAMDNVRISLELALIIASLWSGVSLPENYNNFSNWPVPSQKEQKIMTFAKNHSIYLMSFIHIIHALKNRNDKISHIYYYIFPPKGLLYKYRKSDSILDIPCAYIRRWISFIKYF
ncbi:nucleotidyltransferase family protein [Methanospirillum stamsii]|uniref:nucleotidyltransferase family protein n=1 Tax=Methanospirillum stamsii TaxID=1277351 RepID=UPI0015E855D8|nr:nucleotidyltransferase family protein [Methanospirillum stamsii]